MSFKLACNISIATRSSLILICDSDVEPTEASKALIPIDKTVKAYILCHKIKETLGMPCGMLGNIVEYPQVSDVVDLSTIKFSPCRAHVHFKGQFVQTLDSLYLIHHPCFLILVEADTHQLGKGIIKIQKKLVDIHVISSGKNVLDVSERIYQFYENRTSRMTIQDQGFDVGFLQIDWRARIFFANQESSTSALHYLRNIKQSLIKTRIDQLIG
jgi:hypothetical protein